MSKVSDSELQYYLHRPYTRILLRDPEGGYVAKVAEFPGCVTEGDNPNEAIAMLDDALMGVLDTMIEDGLPIPAPIEEGLFAESSVRA